MKAITVKKNTENGTINVTRYVEKKTFDAKDFIFYHEAHTDKQFRTLVKKNTIPSEEYTKFMEMVYDVIEDNYHEEALVVMKRDMEKVYYNAMYVYYKIQQMIDNNTVMTVNV